MRCILGFYAMHLRTRFFELHISTMTAILQTITFHYCDVILGAMASQITSLTIVYSRVHSSADKKIIKAPRHWSLWDEFTGHRWIPHRWPITRKMFPFNESSFISWLRDDDTARFLHYWFFWGEIHRWPLDSPVKWRVLAQFRCSNLDYLEQVLQQTVELRVIGDAMVFMYLMYHCNGISIEKA